MVPIVTETRTVLWIRSKYVALIHVAFLIVVTHLLCLMFPVMLQSESVSVIPINGAFHVAAHRFSPFIPFTPPSASLSLPLFPPLLKALLDSHSPMLPYKATALVLSEADIESRRLNETEIVNQTLPRRAGQIDASAINRSSSSATALFLCHWLFSFSSLFFLTPPVFPVMYPSFPPFL